MSRPERMGTGIRLMAFAGLLAASGACTSNSPSATGGSSTPSSSASVSSSPTPSSGKIPAVPGGPSSLGITGVQMASAIASNGSAKAPRSTFSAASDRTIIAVVALAHLPVGTKLSYVRYLDGKFVNSKSGTLTKATDYFYFRFNAIKGKMLTRGLYRLRLYVNGHAAWEITYRVA